MANNTEDVPVSDHVYDQSLRCVNCGIVSGHGEQRGNRNCPNLKRYTTQSSSHNTEDVELRHETFDDIEKDIVSAFKRHAMSEPQSYYDRTDTSFKFEAHHLVTRLQAAARREYRSNVQQETNRQKAEMLDNIISLTVDEGEDYIATDVLMNAIEAERKQLEEK